MKINSPSIWQATIIPGIIISVILIFTGWWILDLIPESEISTADKFTYLKEQIYFRIYLGLALVLTAFAFVVIYLIQKMRNNLNALQTQTKFSADSDSIPVTNYREFSNIENSWRETSRNLKEQNQSIISQIEELETILYGMPEGFLVLDNEGKIKKINQQAAKILELELEKSIGRHIRELVLNLDFQEFISELLTGKESMEHDLMFQGSLNEQYLHLRGALLKNNTGEKTGIIVALHDVTRLHQLETIRRDFVANVSHELKTPITSIKGSVETLIQGALKDTNAAKQFLEITSRQADRLNSIIEDLLTLSRLEQGHSGEEGAGPIVFEEYPLHELVHEAIKDSDTIAKEKNISINEDCQKNIRAHINPALMIQALSNLLGNAVKYSEPDTIVNVSVKEVEQELKIFVTDQGHGISSQHLERLFERFYRVDTARSRKMGGTGLGLSIVKHITQVHGGQVTVESKLGQGSTFIIHLPRLLT